MITRTLFLVLLLFDLISEGRNHVGQPCNKIFRICLASNSYCDKENICRCKTDYPVNISLHSCRKGKLYSEVCEYSEECYYYDPNSYCTQLPYRSTCECHTGFTYNDGKKICEKVGGEEPKSANLVYPTAIGLSLVFASLLCCCLVFWHLWKRRNLGSSIFSRRTASHRQQYLSTNLESQRPLPTAPVSDETLPTYDTALSLKVAEDCEAPPSYEEVIGHIQEQATKT